MAPLSKLLPQLTWNNPGQNQLQQQPWGLRWRSSTIFIVATVGIGMFSDLFLYSLIVPILPFILEDRVSVPTLQIQGWTSALLAVYAGASVAFAPLAGFVADRTSSRQAPFLVGLAALLGSTVLLYTGRTVGVLVVARACQGLSGATVWTVGLAMCLDTVGPKNLGKTTGTIFSFISVAPLLGPLLGGLLYEKTGYEGVFGVGASILVIDLVMRFLVIEKRFAKQYDSPQARTCHEDPEQASDDVDEPDEEASLLPEERRQYELASDKSFSKSFPLLLCLRDSRLVLALVVGLVQAIILGAFDSTIPTEAKDLFDFDSLKAGVLFIPLSIGDLILGPVAGWAVDRYGTKPVATIGFGFLVPVLVALRAVDSGVHQAIIIYAALLVLCGIGLAAIGAPSIVEAGAVMQKYHHANPDLFGDNGPYAQLYGLNCMMFNAGLTIGPLLAGSLRDSIGYGNMNAVVAGICLLTSVSCFIWLGGRPRILRGRP